MLRANNKKLSIVVIMMISHDNVAGGVVLCVLGLAALTKGHI